MMHLITSNEQVPGSGRVEKIGISITVKYLFNAMSEEPHTLRFMGVNVVGKTKAQAVERLQTAMNVIR